MDKQKWDDMMDGSCLKCHKLSADVCSQCHNEMSDNCFNQAIEEVKKIIDNELQHGKTDSRMNSLMNVRTKVAKLEKKEKCQEQMKFLQ